MVYGQVPTAPDAQVAAFGDKVDDARVTGGITCDGFRRSVCGMIVRHDKVEIEICFLGQHAADGIFDSADPVAYRNDDRGLAREIFGTEVYLVEFVGSQLRPDLLQVLRTGFFHFDLHGAVFRVYVVEIFLSAFPGVGFRFRIKGFVQMEQLAVAAQV